jgi:protein SCO1/2
MADPNGPAENATHTPEPGEAVPEFSLVNQDGEKIRLADFRGKALVVTFIYTRCPLPDYCPLMSKNFGAIAKEISADPAMKDHVRLLSISIDPEYDQPRVLGQYAKDYGASAAPAHLWELATGKPDEVRRVAKFFGLDYWQDSGQIIHALVTAVIDDEGKVLRIYRGNDWKPADILEDLRQARAK